MKTKKYNMEAMNRFFDWFIKLGGNIYDQYSEHIMDKFVDDEPKISSLKDRTSEIKEKYNHKF
jgi:hypothetical protein